MGDRTALSRSSFLDGVALPAAPLAERARVETDVLAAGEHQPLGHDTGGHAGAAVGDELCCLRCPGRERLGEPRVGGTGNSPRDRVEGLLLAEPADAAARVEEQERWVAEPREDLICGDRVVLARPRLERGRGRLDGLLRQWPGVTAHVDRAGSVVTEVPQQPPATGGPTRAVVEGEHEIVRTDPGASEDPCQLGIVGEWMATTVRRIGADRREVALRVEVNGTGNVPLLVVLPGPHVDEHDAHRAPRGAISSSRISWSGNRSRRSAAQAPASVAQAITVGPDPDSVAPPQPAGGVVRIA